jgi:predicted amidohydrolase
MKIRIVQLGVQEEMAANQARMIAALDTAQVDEWMVFPEGVLSGYFPDHADYLARLDASAIARATEDIQRLVLARKCNCLFGTAFLHEGRWRNSVVLLTSTGVRQVSS